MLNTIREVKRSWVSYPSVHLTTLVVLSATFSVLIFSASLYRGFDKILLGVGKRVTMSVYLSDLAGVEERSEIETYLNQVKNIEKINYIDKATAAENLVASMGEHIKDLVVVGEFENPLPNSFELNLSPGLSGGEKGIKKMDLLASGISTLRGVDDVSYGRSWVENYASFAKVFRASSYFVFVVLIGASLFVIGNSIRHSIFQRREEVEILELVGATPWAIRKNFIIEGSLLGLFGSLIACGIAAVILTWQSHIAGSDLGVVQLGAVFGEFSIGLSVFFVLLGTLIGAIGSYLCISSINDGWAATRQSKGSHA